jgi:hypothetical protein
MNEIAGYKFCYPPQFAIEQVQFFDSCMYVSRIVDSGSSRTKHADAIIIRIPRIWADKNSRAGHEEIRGHSHSSRVTVTLLESTGIAEK